MMFHMYLYIQLIRRTAGCSSDVRRVLEENISFYYSRFNLLSDALRELNN